MKEIWKDVVGYEGLYMISNLGNVISNRRIDITGKRLLSERVIRPIMCGKKTKQYQNVILTKKGIRTKFFVHRLVAIAFIPNHLNKPQVNHIDSNRQNNKVENLEWVTASENTIHGFLKGYIRPQYGEKHGMAKLSDSDVNEIIQINSMYGVNPPIIAKEYGVSRQRIWQILTGWRRKTKLNIPYGNYQVGMV